MIKIMKADGTAEIEFLCSLEKRNSETDKKVTAIVSEIIESVKARGDVAVLEYTEKFDGIKPLKYEVTLEELKAAVNECDKDFIEALGRAAKNIAEFHSRQNEECFRYERADGSVLGRKVSPLEKVGIYVPGGTAAYPSSVLMNALPAKIAGVKEIIMVTPPLKDGTANKNILAAAFIAGVDRVFMMGGAQAVAALAFGTALVPKVDKIVGPGNIFVATAKKLVFGACDIDMIAGPSEILILADKTAKAEYLAADLMSQAEHDVLASSILLTDSMEIANATIEQLEIQVEALGRKDIIVESLRNYGAIIVFDKMDDAIGVSNRLAPEHLEICLEEPFLQLEKITNAGSIFLGNYSPEPLGDYYAGPNHVLPTGGTARFFSPLSVSDFIKKSNYICYSKEALQNASDDIILLAETEGLTAHANSIIVRKG